jgi:hypothetical protein
MIGAALLAAPFYLGGAFHRLGPQVDLARTVRLGPGSVVTGPADTPHDLVTGPDGAVFQIVTEGPFVTDFVVPAP